MRNLYVLLTLTITFMVILLVFTFIFLEKEKHQTLFYTVEINGDKIGNIKIDRYKPEDKIIYKATSFYPKEPGHEIIHEKLVFDRKGFKIEKFFKECKKFGTVTEEIYIKNNSDETFDFLAKFQSKFSTVSGVLHHEDISVFNEGSLVTYMPFIDKYNFSRGGAQSFNAVYHALNLLPPGRAKIIFSSIRDEYIKTGRKKTKTEFLVVKAKALPKIYIWISKKDRNIVQLKNESKSLIIKKVPLFHKIAVENYRMENKFFDLQTVIFPSEDIGLAGTIAVPRKEGKLPSVLLVASDGSYDRENAGFYTDIGRELAKSGYVVMYFDKRGIGKSQGNNMETSLQNTIKDIESALKFLTSQEKIDKDRMFVLAHGDACSYLPLVNFSKNPLRGILMLGVTEARPILNFECEYVARNIRVMTEMGAKYPKILESAKEETLKLVTSTEKEYSVVQAKRVFLERMRQLLRLKPLEEFKKLDMPLVIIYGDKDVFGSLGYIRDIETTLNAAGLKQFSTVSFRNLGRFLGELVERENIEKHYEVNKEVLDTIRGWIDDKCKEIDKKALVGGDAAEGEAAAVSAGKE